MNLTLQLQETGAVQETAQFHRSVQSLRAGMQSLRLLAAMPAALVATLLLVWGMERLIHAGDQPSLVEPLVYKIPDPVMPAPKPLEILYRRPTPPEKVEMEPEPLDLELTLTRFDGPAVPPLVAPPTGGKPLIGAYSNDMPIPTMLVQPAYPASAANKGIKGYVDVQFDVAATGATDNIVIIASVPPSVFDRETIKAVKRWKFNPVIKDGRAVAYKGVVQRVHFEMQKT